MKIKMKGDTQRKVKCSRERCEEGQGVSGGSYVIRWRFTWRVSWYRIDNHFTSLSILISPFTFCVAYSRITSHFTIKTRAYRNSRGFKITTFMISWIWFFAWSMVGHNSRVACLLHSRIGVDHPREQWVHNALFWLCLKWFYWKNKKYVAPFVVMCLVAVLSSIQCALPKNSPSCVFFSSLCWLWKPLSLYSSYCYGWRV